MKPAKMRGLEGMGTTIVAALALGNDIAIASVGRQPRLPF